MLILWVVDTESYKATVLLTMRLGDGMSVDSMDQVLHSIKSAVANGDTLSVERNPKLTLIADSFRLSVIQLDPGEVLHHMIRMKTNRY